MPPLLGTDFAALLWLVFFAFPPRLSRDTASPRRRRKGALRRRPRGRGELSPPPSPATGTTVVSLSVDLVIKFSVLHSLLLGTIHHPEIVACFLKAGRQPCAWIHSHEK